MLCWLLYPLFSWRFGKDWRTKVNFVLTLALFYFLLSSCWFWKREVHFQSGEADNWLPIPWRRPREAGRTGEALSTERSPQTPRPTLLPPHSSIFPSSCSDFASPSFLFKSSKDIFANQRSQLWLVKKSAMFSSIPDLRQNAPLLCSTGSVISDVFSITQATEFWIFSFNN